MGKNTEYQKGDWVQFYSAGHLVIDEMQGTKVEIGGYRYVLTMHNGEVSFDCIHAVRRDDATGGRDD